ncbi:FAD-binding oxidoreductase [Chromatiales bacterium (ex Bugula neritina AB1)]|nr:FAD-binding oxidoreductase [Chromatiales bacterium (ex Bugula neritina AB1)]
MNNNDQSLPIAIIGAGIVGVSTAIWCQRAGLRTILIDREGPASGTSFGNAGVLASASVVPVTVPGLIAKAPRMLLDKKQPLFLNWSYLPTLMPWLTRYLSHCKPEVVARIASALNPILSNSLEDHQALAAGTGAEKFISPAEYVYVYKDRAHFESDKFGWQVRKDNGFTWTEYEGDAWNKHDPVFNNTQKFAASVHNHGRISDPGCYVQQLARHFEDNGGKIIQATVEGLADNNGQVSGVRTTTETIACSAAVIAAGAWSKPLLGELGCDIPLEAERGYHIELYEPSAMPRMPSMIAAGKFVMTPMDGRLRIAGMVEFGGLVAGANRAPIDYLKNYIHQVIPGLKWTETTEWLGHRPAPVDSVPVIGEAPAMKGAFMGFGHQHVGLTGGARTGQLLAQLVSGQTPEIDMTPYSPLRFNA